MTQTTDAHALQGMLDEEEELAQRLNGQHCWPGPDGAALRADLLAELDTLGRCIRDHEADMARRSDEEPDTMANLGVRY